MSFLLLLFSWHTNPFLEAPLVLEAMTEKTLCEFSVPSTANVAFGAAGGIPMVELAIINKALPGDSPK